MDPIAIVSADAFVGNALVTEKHTQSGQDERFAWALSEMQGWRVSESFPPTRLPISATAREGPEPPLTYLADMEDAHTALLKLDEDSGNAFFAVFDGHGGAPLIICANL